MMRNRGILFVFLGLILVATPQEASSQALQKDSEPESVPGQLLVRFKERSASARANLRPQAAALQTLRRKLGARSISDFKALAFTDQIALLRLANASQTRDAIDALRADAGVESVEPNYVYRVQGFKGDAADSESESQTSPSEGSGAASGGGAPMNDPEFPKLWGLQNTGQDSPDAKDGSGSVSPGSPGTVGSDINVVPVWDRGIKGSSIRVAILDTGVDSEHPDLKENIWINPKEAGEKSSNGIDDDGNGFADDVNGWNFLDGNRSTADYDGHGTHVAGTIGAIGNNALGVVGMAPQVSIVPVKFIGPEGGTTENAINAVDYATKLGVDVMSNSWSGGGYSQLLKEAIERARDKGIVFVAAAGNTRGGGNDNDIRPHYPASYDVDNIVSVAALDNRDRLASFSHFGKRSVHVAAPGVRILSTVLNGQYDVYSGTSMATPHVSGLVALMLGQDRSLAPKEIRDRLIRTSVRVQGLKGYVASKGRVNADNALNDYVPPVEDPDEGDWIDVAWSAESDHPYASYTDKKWTFEDPSARFVRVVFETVETEGKYDPIHILDGKDQRVDTISGEHKNAVSEYVKGSKLTIHFKSDDTVNRWGFKVGKIQIVR